jgi:hypothetical protein
MAMMSREERRRLAAIERQMLNDDPAFAHLFTRSLQSTGSVWRKATAAVIGALLALAAIAGLLASSIELVVTAAALSLAAAWMFRLTRPSTG